jgi:aryl-alcohol dehydrogenase-like predicted oxidoreductase
VVSVQNHYNIAQREGDDVVDFCEERGIAFIPWFPLASGKLAGPGGPLDRVAGQLGATVPQVCLAWLLRRSPVMVPIPGTASVEHLRENHAAGGISLSDEQYEALVDARKPLRRWALAG